MAPCVMDFELELTQIHNWLDVFVTFRPSLEHVYSKASQQTKNIYWSMVICNNFVQVSKILCNRDGQTKWLLRPSRTTILDNISHLKSSRIASLWGRGGPFTYCKSEPKLFVYVNSAVCFCRKTNAYLCWFIKGHFLLHVFYKGRRPV